MASQLEQEFISDVRRESIAREFRGAVVVSAEVHELE
jgi:hypothetical protein